MLTGILGFVSKLLGCLGLSQGKGKNPLAEVYDNYDFRRDPSIFNYSYWLMVTCKETGKSKYVQVVASNLFYALNTLRVQVGIKYKVEKR